MMLLGLIGWTNQIGVGTVITIVGLVGALFLIRSNLSSIQSDQIHALERQVDVQKKQLKDAEKSALEARAQLAEERAKTDLTSVTTLLKAQIEGQQAEREALRSSIDQARSEHVSIVETMESMKDALDLLVDWGRASLGGKPKEH